MKDEFKDIEEYNGFSRNESYYDGVVYEWNLPAGWACPYAEKCKVTVGKRTGKMEYHGSEYRCYAASAERFPSCRQSRWRNFRLVARGRKPNIPKEATAIRIHASGDFFNQAYFDMWLDICRSNPTIEFWAFTKSLPYWVNRLNVIPKNLILTASRGGREDSLIDKYKLKNVEVVSSRDDIKGRLLDTKDDMARLPYVNFVLLDNNKKHD